MRASPFCTTFALALMLFLPACARRAQYDGGPSTLSYSAPARVEPAQSAIVPFAALPAGAGQVVEVRERVGEGVISQIILLGPGEAENRIDFALERTRGLISKPSEYGIREELRTRFPGVAMRVVEPRRNAYGPVGLAAGHDGETACIYAWQWIDNVRSGSGLLSGLMSRGPGGSLRVRLCRRGASYDELAAYVTRLSVAVPANVWQSRSGVASASYERSTSIRQDGWGPSPELRSTPVKPRPRHVPAKRPAQPKPEAEPAWNAPENLPISGPRYLAPATPLPAVPAPNAPAGYDPQARSGAPAGGLDPSLPPEAYRGPNAQPR